MTQKLAPFLTAMEERLRAPEFAFIAALVDAFPAAEVYLVGGAVRDAALNRESKDYDFVVAGVPAEELQRFLGQIGIVNFVGRVFGVLKFVPDAAYDQVKILGLEPFDIALPRTEIPAGTGGYRDVAVKSDHTMRIEDDLSRRDFTVNAMAAKLATSNQRLVISELVDPFHGCEDVQAKIIRAVGKPEERFQEDYTRMLRALRLAVQLGFKIESATQNAIEQLVPHLDDMHNGVHVTPRETIAKELIRAYVAKPLVAFDLAEELGIHRVLFPEFAAMKTCPQPYEWHAEGDVFTHTRLAMTHIGSTEFADFFGDREWDALLVFAVLLHDVGKPATLKTPEDHGADRVRFDGHDEVGAKMVGAIADRLKLSSMPEGSRYHINRDHLVWLVRNHLISMNPAEEMRSTTIEKYFYNPLVPGDHLLRLTFCDGSASLPAHGGASDLSNLRALIDRVKKVGIMSEAKKRLPKPLIDGIVVMETLGLPPSKQIGDILKQLREEQLLGNLKTPEEAIEYLKNHYTE